MGHWSWSSAPKVRPPRSPARKRSADGCDGRLDGSVASVAGRADLEPLEASGARHPDDLDASQAHLEKALELDPELAEPYPWLCYVLMRKNQMDRALQAGSRGVELQPDLVHAHYFLGLAHFAAAERDPG